MSKTRYLGNGTPDFDEIWCDDFSALYIGRSTGHFSWGDRPLGLVFRPAIRAGRKNALQTFPGQSLSRTDVSRTRRFPDNTFPGQSLSRTRRFPERRFPDKTFSVQDYSRTITFPDRRFLDRRFPDRRFPDKLY